MTRPKLFSLFVVLGALFFFNTKAAFAMACDIVPATATLTVGQSGTATVSISNVGDEIITYARFINPDSAYMTFTSGSSTGFSASTDGQTITFSGGSVLPSAGASFAVTVTPLAATSEELQIDGFVSADGGDYTQCYSSSGITIVEPSATTAPAATPTTITVTNTVTTVTTTTNTVTKVLKDETPPSVKIQTEIKKIYEEAPLIKAVATDGSGISKIEYSNDAGANWIPVDIEDNIGNKTVTFGFTSDITEDGDYNLKIRATDTSGNKTLSKEIKFTIDRLPPRTGPILIMTGPTIIYPDSSGITRLLAGVDYKFIVSAAGGPNKISIFCNDKSVDFTKNSDSGFWYSMGKFDEGLECTAKLKAEDGAGNVQEVEKGNIKVSPLGKFENGTITVYWYDDFLNKFIKWDGEAFGQENPIKTGKSGGYGFVLPAGGKYYLEAKSFGKKTGISNIITTTETVYINDNWTLSPFYTFWQKNEIKNLSPKAIGGGAWRQTNTDLPNVVLSGFSTLEARGKFTVFGLVSSWHPLANDYLKVADELSKNKVTFIPVLIQEKDAAAGFLKRRGGYNLDILADPDGELLKDISVNGLPTTWIVNRFGKIIQEKTGSIDAQEILKMLTSTE